MKALIMERIVQNNRCSRLTMRIKENLTGYSMIIPAMFFFFLFLVFPVFKAIQISLYDYSGVGKMTDFIGLDNYMKSILDIEFFMSILNTLKLVVFDLIISTMVGFFLAYALFKRIGGWKFFSVALYIPSIVTVVVSGLIWRQIYEPNQGLLNSILRSLELDGLAKIWIGDMDIAMNSVIIAWIWKTIPFIMLILYSAMVRIPEELFESARIDGASEWNIIGKIVFPCMMPVIGVLTVLTIATDFRAFDMVQILTQGGPGNATEIATLYVYKMAVSIGEYGYANAVAVEIFFIVGILVFLLVGLLRKIGFSNND